jgi:tetratricopeptide (TPR) repeat protein
VLAAATAAPVAGQVVPEAGLRAEIEGRWDDAIRIHRAALAQQPDRADLWVRIADIEARRGQLALAIEANREAARLAPADAELQARLAAAHATAGEVEPALAAARRATLLRPDHVPYLQVRAELATWAGRYALAQLSYLEILRAVPDDPAALLAMARVNAWSGRTNEAVRDFRRYLSVQPDDSMALLEYARVEAWRGNYAAAVAVLDEYRARYGASADYDRELARVLAGTRPNRALEIADEALTRDPADAGLHKARALALGTQFRFGPALDALSSLRRLSPDSRETRTAEKVIRTPLRPALMPLATIYSDSDSLTIYRFAPEFSFSLAPDTRIHAGGETQELHARHGSGLERADGRTSVRHRRAWIGLTQRLAPGTLLDGRVGLAEAAEGPALPTYRIGGRVALHDTFRLMGHKEHAVLAVSPRTIGDGLTRHASQIGMEWEIGLRHTLEARAELDRLSDGNQRRAFSASFRRSLARRERINLDMSLNGSWFGFDHARTGLGYYAPARHETYSVGWFAYWKLGDSHGFGLTGDGGLQRDELDSTFRLGGNATATGTFGLYDDWMLQVHASATQNRRLATGAFGAGSGGIALTRRF